MLAGVSERVPMRAWAVRVAPGVALDVVRADGRERPSEIAARTGACAVLNGGYFDLATGRPVGAFVDADVDTVATPAFAAAERDGVSFALARGALGVTADGRAEIAWAVPCAVGPCRVASPPAHRAGQPDTAWAAVPEPWAIREVVQAGPVLVRDGRAQVTADDEVFFGTSIPETHPRSAIGVTAEGGVVLLVIDGRQAASRGATLGETAALLLGLGARDGLNLDGGGSSALMAAGVRLNLPTGYDVERPVASALAVRCE